MDAESVRETLKIYSLTITNAILMKLTTIMYLHETVADLVVPLPVRSGSVPKIVG